jgi:hypothetical protein
MLVACRLAGLSTLEVLCRGQRGPAISSCGKMTRSPTTSRMAGRAVPNCGNFPSRPSGLLTSAERRASIGSVQCPRSGEPGNGGSTLSLLAAFSRSPPRSRQTRCRPRRTTLSACSRTRPSPLLGRQKPPFLLHRQTMTFLSNLRWRQSSHWTMIAMGSPPAFFAVWRRSGNRMSSR